MPREGQKDGSNFLRNQLLLAQKKRDAIRVCMTEKFILSYSVATGTFAGKFAKVQKNRV